MVRALVLTLPLICATVCAIGTTFSSIEARAESSPTTSSTGSSTGASQCDWENVAINSKMSSECQKDLEGKLTNEQDKVYARRLFKDWKPDTEADFYADETFVQISGEGDYLFQAVWIKSSNPAILWVNGKIVTDDVKDNPSIYMRIDRLLKKAEGTKTASFSPLRSWLVGDQAEAQERRRRRTRQQQAIDERNALFVYTVNGQTGTAEELMQKQGAALKGAVLPSGSFLENWTSGQSFSCDGNRVSGSLDAEVNGKKVKIESMGAPASRTEFKITGLTPDGKTLLVKVRGKPMNRFACHGGRGDKSAADGCKAAWAAFGSKYKSEYESGLARVRKGMQDKQGYVSDIKFDSDLQCGKVFGANKAIRNECQRHFRGANFVLDGSDKSADESADSAPGAKTLSERKLSGLSMQVCEDPSCSKRKGTNLNRVVEQLDPTLTNQYRTPSDQAKAAARTEYRSALSRYKLEADKICGIPEPVMSTMPDGMATGLVQDDGFANCNAPPRDLASVPQAQRSAARRDLDSAYKLFQNPLKAELAQASKTVRTPLEARLMGLMMLGDCCASDSCRSKASSWQGLNVNLKPGSQKSSPAKQ